MLATSQLRYLLGRQALTLACVLGGAGSAAGQVRPGLPVSPPQPPASRPPLEKSPLPALTADLYIKRIDFVGPPFGLGATGHATLTIGNAGNAPADIPAGTVLVKAESRPGGLTYRPLDPTYAQSILPAGETMVGFDVREYCSAGFLPDTVTFTLDPGGKIAERKDNNVVKAVPNAADVRKADLVVSAMKFSYPTLAKGPTDPLDLVVTIKNVGTGPALLACALSAIATDGLYKEVESPVSGKYGLRPFQSPDLPRTIEPGKTYNATLRNAYRLVDLTPGSYVWKVQIDPLGHILETDKGNNMGTTTVTIPPPS